MSRNKKISKLWIIKGNKDNLLIDDRDGDIVEHMHDCINAEKEQKERIPNWWIQRRKKISSDFLAHPRSQIVLAWRSRKNIGIVGLGRLTKVLPYGIEKEVDGFVTEPNEHWFDWEPVQCFCEECNKKNKLYKYISIERIKSVFSTDIASDDTPIFIQPSVIQTVYPVNDKQASRLLGLIEQSVELNLKSKRVLSALGAPRPRHSALAERNA